MGKSNNSYTAAFKLKVIFYAEKYGKRAAAREFKVHEKCVRNWCKQREELSATHGSRRAFRGKKSQFPSIETKIIDYIRDMCTMGHKVTREMCRIKAVALAEKEGIPLNQFKASEGWFQRMVRRNISSFEDDFSKLKGQKEIAAKREAGLISDVVQEVPSAEQTFNSVPQTSSAQTYSEHSNDLEYRTPQDINSSQVPLPSAVVESSSAVQQTYSKYLNDLVYKTPQDTNITEVISSVPQDISSSQVSLSSSTVNPTLSFAKCVVEGSSIAQQTSNVQTYSKHTTYPMHRTLQDTNITEIISDVPQDINSSQVSLSSAAVKDNYQLPFAKSVVEDNYQLPFAKSVVESCSTVQKTSSLRTYSKHKNEPVHKTPKGTNITKLISGIPQDINSSRVSLSSATVEGNSILSLAKSAVERSDSLLKISSADCSSLPVVSSTVRRSRRISSNDQPSILSINSTAVKDASSTQRVLRRDDKSVATQINFDAKKNKITKLKPLPNEVPIRGRRIIDFQYFFRALKEVNNHSEVGCNLNNMIITSERKSGICTAYNLKCVVCNFEKEIWSEKESKKRNLNTEFVSSILSIKCSFQEANLLLAKMHLPSLSHADFVKEYKKVVFPSSKVDSKKTSETISGKNVQREPQLATVQQCSSASDNSSLLQQVELDGLLVEDQFEIKEENSIENEFETLIPDQRVRTSDDKLIDGQEQVIFTTTIKQEINSDEEDFTSSITNETPNKENITENKEEYILGTVLPQQNEAKACENTMIVNKAQVNLQKNVMVENIQDSNMLVKLEHDTMEITDKENTTYFDKEVEAGLPLKKAKIVTYSKLDNLADTQGIETTAPSKEINTFQSMFESNGLVTATSSILTSGNVTETPSTIAGENVTATSSLTNAENVAVLIPVQHMAKSNGNETLIVSQMPHTISSGTYQDAKGAAFIPGTPTIVPQHTGQSSSGVLPLVSVHQSWANNFNTMANNPFILFPGPGGAAYMPGIPAAIQQPANAVPITSRATYVPLTSTLVQQPVNSSNRMPGIIPVAIQQPSSLSNVVPSASGTTYVPLTPTVNQQPANSSNRPPMNTDGSRWIGRENINSNNPFCTLPGGAPKGVSDPATPKSDSDQSNHQAKRPRFRCDDCDISFAKHESWDSHKQIYCIKRLKLPPSSTVTNHTLMNNPFPPSCATVSIKPHMEELLSAMAIKRSFLEASMKTALDAQYVINRHKSAQDLTQKSFKELDTALHREKALMPEASLGEQRVVSEARARALIRAEAAYIQEKHAAAAVEQALYRQKITIEATLTATGHEQTALISTLKGLKVQANQNDMSSICQTKCSETSFNQEKLVSTPLAKSTNQQQIVHSISSKSAPVHTTSHGNVSHLNVPSEKLSTVNFEENKAVTTDILPPQCKEINAMISYSSTNAPSFQNYEKRLPSVFHSQKGLDLNAATSAETSSTPEYEKESMSCDYSHLEEPRDLNTRVFSENPYVTVYQADKSFVQRVKSDEMMDINITPSTENIPSFEL